MDRRRSISFAIMIASLAPVLLGWRASSGIKILKTPYHAKRPNAICEGFLGSVRRECLDHMLIIHEKQLHRILNAYVAYFKRARPHQGIHQQTPEPCVPCLSFHHEREKVIAGPILGGLGIKKELRIR